MQKILVKGGKPLHGTIRISGAKNAALPLMTASILTGEDFTLTNLPELTDVMTMAKLLRQHGVDVTMASESGNGEAGQVLTFNASKITSTTAPYDLVKQMRASILVLGPLLARCGHARVSLPGGCAIGARPVDLHLKAMEALGAKIDIQEGYLEAKAPDGLKGGEIVFPIVSVGATENALMAATLADGETIITNAAREPEIINLAESLKAMGAQIEGAGSDEIRIKGVSKLHKAQCAVVADRIEFGSYVIAAAITNGELLLTHADLKLIPSLSKKLKEAGVSIEATPEGVLVKRQDAILHGTDVVTEPFPGFATDLQAQFMTLMTIAEGASLITETIFENRFMHVPELKRLGADLSIQGSSVLVRGVKGLKGAQVMATDLRASVSLVLAGLVATGETLIDRVYHLDRGYERLEQKLSACGAEIRRISA